MAKAGGWEVKPGQAGWGTHEAMLDALESAVKGDFVLGDRFSMADVIFGGTMRFMLRFNMLEPRPAFTAYAERLAARPACQAAEAKNGAIATELGLAR
jgi:glutathione S-transferase